MNSCHYSALKSSNLATFCWKKRLSITSALHKQILKHCLSSMGWKTDPLHHLFHVQADVFGAGVDTALNTLRWAILVACKYPAQQRVLREEIDDALRSDDTAKAVGMEHYDQLHYTRVSAVCCIEWIL